MSSLPHYPVRFFLVFLVVWVATPASEGMSFTSSIILLEYFYLSPVKFFFIPFFLRQVGGCKIGGGAHTTRKLCLKYTALPSFWLFHSESTVH